MWAHLLWPVLENCSACDAESLAQGPGCYSKSAFRFVSPSADQWTWSESSVQLLKSHSEIPEAYFTYRCPDALCYGSWKRRPVRSYLHGTVNEHMAKALEDRNPCTVVAQSGGADPFSGIFGPWVVERFSGCCVAIPLVSRYLCFQVVHYRIVCEFGRTDTIVWIGFQTDMEFHSRFSSHSSTQSNFYIFKSGPGYIDL